MTVLYVGGPAQFIDRGLGSGTTTYTQQSRHDAGREALTNSFAHDPILIEGNANFTASNGVVSGDGTPANPYRIEGWDIDASQADGVHIGNTSAYFVLSNISVHSATQVHYGVFLYQVFNASVTNVTITGTAGGVACYFCNYLLVSGNNIAQTSAEGILLLERSAHVPTTATFSHNVLDRTGGGVAIGLASSGVVVSDNVITYSGGYGILLSYSSDASITGNRIVSSATDGLVLSDSGGATIKDNVVSGSNAYVALNLFYSGYSVVEHNSFSSSRWDGINAFSSSYSTISNNSLTGNSRFGIMLTDSYVNLINNTISRNAKEGLYLDTLASRCVGFSTIYHNRFLNNNPGAASQAYSICSWQDHWTNGYPQGGNYWSNYDGTDNCSGPNQDICTGPDGIGDTPYIIDSDSYDRYPLMTSGITNSRPVASFSVTPNSGDTTTVFNFDASSCQDADDPSALLQVRWDWQDDGVWDTSWTTSKTIQHLFESPGVYTVELEVRDSGGLTNTTTRQVTVLESPLQVFVSANPTSGNAPLTVYFGSDVRGGAPPYRYSWTFGDGGTSTEMAPTHTYRSSGAYEVTLMVTDAHGNRVARTTMITVASSPAGGPVAGMPSWAYYMAALVIAVAAFSVVLFHRRRAGGPRS